MLLLLAHHHFRNGEVANVRLESMHAKCGSFFELPEDLFRLWRQAVFQIPHPYPVPAAKCFVISA